jgi:hypothetical protein
MFARDIGHVKSGAFSFRSKMRRALLLIPLVVVVALVGCGEGHSGGTQLTMVVTSSSFGHVSRAVFHLSCQPPRGDFPSPAKSCAWVEKDPKIVTNPKLIIKPSKGKDPKGTNPHAVARRSHLGKELYFSGSGFGSSPTPFGCQ